MRTIQVQYDFGITKSDKGNAVLFFEIVRPDGVVARNFGNNALKRAQKYSKIFGHNIYLEVKALKETTDTLYLTKKR